MPTALLMQKYGPVQEHRTPGNRGILADEDRGAAGKGTFVEGTFLQLKLCRSRLCESSGARQFSVG